MKTGIIGLPQVGKTSLFRILTKAHLSEHAYSNPREAHVGIAKVPDDRLDRLAALFHHKKLTHATVEYVNVGDIGQEALSWIHVPQRKTDFVRFEHQRKRGAGNGSHRGNQQVQAEGSGFASQRRRSSNLRQSGGRTLRDV